METTIEGTPTVTMTLRDPRGRLFAAGRTRAQRPTKKQLRNPEPPEVDEGWDAILPPNILGRAMDLKLDGVTFRLVKVRYSSATQEAELTFEHRLVYWLKRKRGEKRVSRAKVTRAQFILGLLREVRELQYRFVCPELDVRQPMAKAEREKTDTTAEEGQPGTGDPAGLKVKGSKATNEQVRNAEIALGVAAELKAGPKATLAMMCAAIGESNITTVINSLGYGGVFQGQVNTGGRYFKANDTAAMARCFLKGGKGFGAGGAIALAKAIPDMSPGTIATKVEVSGKAGSFYDEHRDEAQKFIDVIGEGSADVGDSGGGTYRQSYQFVREAKENSWAGHAATRRGGRLAHLRGRQLALLHERGAALRSPPALRDRARRPGHPRPHLRRRLGQAGRGGEPVGGAGPVGRTGGAPSSSSTGSVRPTAAGWSPARRGTGSSRSPR